MLTNKLPAHLKPLFWDINFSRLVWEKQSDFIIRRILQSGGIKNISWLRSRVSDEFLRNWFVQHRGKGLSPRQLRYWGLILEIPEKVVDPWVEREKASIWGKRIKG